MLQPNPPPRPLTRQGHVFKEVACLGEAMVNSADADCLHGNDDDDCP